MMAQERVRGAANGGHHIQMMNMLQKNSAARAAGSASGTRIKIGGNTADIRRVR